MKGWLAIVGAMLVLDASAIHAEEARKGSPEARIVPLQAMKEDVEVVLGDSRLGSLPAAQG